LCPSPARASSSASRRTSAGADIDLTEEEFGRIEAELAKIEIHGNRTDEDIAKLRDLH
jgi:hypothetical protein